MYLTAFYACSREKRWEYVLGIKVTFTNKYVFMFTFEFQWVSCLKLLKVTDIQKMQPSRPANSYVTGLITFGSLWNIAIWLLYFFNVYLHDCNLRSQERSKSWGANWWDKHKSISCNVARIDLDPHNLIYLLFLSQLEIIPSVAILGLKINVFIFL